MNTENENEELVDGVGESAPEVVVVVVVVHKAEKDLGQGYG